ncbi:MAG: acetylglutamate kinase [Bacteroidales bacterium]|nr:acetylglutamate kinase [Bacteroidales bacterium]
MRNSEKPILLFKYGGNAMTNNKLKKQVLSAIIALKSQGYQVVIVHGGGPFIEKALSNAKIVSEFIDGHRKTSTEALEHIEMALKGQVNGSIVSLINSMGHHAVGLSGKDGGFVTAEKRVYRRITTDKTEELDLGQVGDVLEIDTKLIHLLLQNDYIPVVTCLAMDKEGNDYNINADMFAGELAGALKVKDYVILTDVDGLLMDKDDPESLISELRVNEIEKLVEQKIIQGGMLPKMESCAKALSKGASTAKIINGTKPEQISWLSQNLAVGTTIKL